MNRELSENTPFERFNTLDLSPVAHFTIDRRDIIAEANLRAAELLGEDISNIVQKPFTRFVLPEDVERYRDYRRRVFDTEKKRVCELTLAKKNGFGIFARLESVVTEPGSDEFCMAVFDVTEWKLASEELRLFESAVRQMRESVAIFSTGAGDAKIVFVNPAFARLSGFAASEAIGQTMSLLEGKSGSSAATVRAFKQLRRGKDAMIEAVNHTKRGAAFDAEWHLTPVRDTRGLITHFLGLQLDVTSRKKREKAGLDLAQGEQERIGRDLHDGLCQNLTALSFTLRALKGRLETASPKEAAETQKVLEMAGQALMEARDLSESLGPIEEETGSLEGALKRLASYVKKIYGITCHLELDPVVRIPDPAQAANLYRIAQEALNNSAEHSQAENIWLGLTEKSGKICLTVKDDGLGIRRTAPKRKGHGLRLMQHRANLMNAKLEVKRLYGKGTLVRCAVQSQN